MAGTWLRLLLNAWQGSNTKKSMSRTSAIDVPLKWRGTCEIESKRYLSNSRILHINEFLEETHVVNRKKNQFNVHKKLSPYTDNIA